MTIETGMYQTPTGRIFKVQTSRQSGHSYAKELKIIGGQRLVETGERVSFEFAYAPGAIRMLAPDMRMTMEQAKTFGIQYGVCCVCAAWLKDATSVERGMGPVCRKRIEGVRAR